ncbi:MAG TPA: DUF4491 family protein [Anaerolineales bacterium]|nr:DUF4491 family protein [Anaerolineales bacterium]
MSLSVIGPVAALGAFFGIWFGHVAVRKIEFIARDIRIPALVALAAGLALEAASLAAGNRAVSALFGILGVTLLWDALEFWRQQNRVKHGHAPANPDNPRHARILAEYPEATTYDWLDRSPRGRAYTAEELEAIREAQR